MGAGAPPSLRRPATASQLSPSPPASRRRRSPGTGLPPGRPRAASASLLVQPRRGSSRAVFRQLPRCVGRRRGRWKQPGLPAKYIRRRSLVGRTIVTSCPWIVRKGDRTPRIVRTVLVFRAHLRVLSPFRTVQRRVKAIRSGLRLRRDGHVVHKWHKKGVWNLGLARTPRVLHRRVGFQTPFL